MITYLQIEARFHHCFFIGFNAKKFVWIKSYAVVKNWTQYRARNFFASVIDARYIWQIKICALKSRKLSIVSYPPISTEEYIQPFLWSIRGFISIYPRNFSLFLSARDILFIIFYDAFLYKFKKKLIIRLFERLDL